MSSKDPDFTVATWDLDGCGKGKASMITKEIHDILLSNEIDILILQGIGYPENSPTMSCREILGDMLTRVPQYALASTDSPIGVRDGGKVFLPLLYNKRKIKHHTTEALSLGNESPNCVRYRLELNESNFIFDLINVHFPSPSVASEELNVLLQRYEKLPNEYPVLCAGDFNLSPEQYPPQFDNLCSSAGRSRDHQIFLFKHYQQGTVHETYEYEILPSPIVPSIPSTPFAVNSGNKISSHDCLISRIILQSQ